MRETAREDSASALLRRPCDLRAHRIEYFGFAQPVHQQAQGDLQRTALRPDKGSRTGAAIHHALELQFAQRPGDGGPRYLPAPAERFLARQPPAGIGVFPGFNLAAEGFGNGFVLAHWRVEVGKCNYSFMF